MRFLSGWAISASTRSGGYDGGLMSNLRGFSLACRCGTAHGTPAQSGGMSRTWQQGHHPPFSTSTQFAPRCPHPTTYTMRHCDVTYLSNPEQQLCWHRHCVLSCTCASNGMCSSMCTQNVSALTPSCTYGPIPH